MTAQTIIYAGIGTDARKVAEKIGRDNINTHLFVDPSLKKLEGKVHANVLMRAETLEEFILKTLLDEPELFQNSEMISDRMIEHIELGKLSSLIFPLIKNLIYYFDMTVDLTYPDMDEIYRYFKTIDPSNLLEHHLCNIEAIAFGDHKVLLNENILQYYFGTLNCHTTTRTIDSKPFYKELRITRYDKDYEPLPMEENPSYHMITSDDKKVDISEFFWNFSNVIDMSCHIPFDRLYLFRYISMDKVQTFYNDQAVRFIPTDFLTCLYDTVIERIITREGHFKLVDFKNANIYNLVHPYERVVAFKKS